MATSSDDWTLNPGPASLWPAWTDLARYELGPEAAAQVGEVVALTPGEASGVEFFRNVYAAIGELQAKDDSPTREEADHA